MDDDAMDQLVDDATHAVVNLIPTDAYHELSSDEQEALTISINDALSGVLKEALQ